MSVGLSLVLSSGPLIHHITSKAAVSSGVNNLENVLQTLLPPREQSELRVLVRVSSDHKLGSSILVVNNLQNVLQMFP